MDRRVSRCVGRFHGKKNIDNFSEYFSSLQIVKKTELLGDL